MTHSRFFQVCLFIPLVLWVIGLIVVSLFLKQDDSGILQGLRDGYRVFVPYLIFAAGVWKLADNKPYRLLLLMAFFVPIAWGFFFVLCFISASFLKERAVEAVHILLIMAFWATFVAYLVELIPLFIMTNLKDRFRSVSDTPRQPAGAGDVL